MSSDLVSFKVALNSVAPEAQLAFPDPFGAGFLAKRMKVALGKAKQAEAIEKLQSALKTMSVAQRRGLLIDRSAKGIANHPSHYFDIARATGVAFTEGQKITPAFLAALEDGLARIDGATLAKLLEERWLYSTLYINAEIWTLHVLLHQIEGDVLPPPATAHIALDIECIHPDASMPKSNDEKAIRDLAVRVLGFLHYGGPIDAQLRGTDVVEPPTIPLKVAMTNRKNSSATVHVLTSREAAAPYAEGLAERSTAW